MMRQMHNSLASHLDYDDYLPPKAAEVFAFQFPQTITQETRFMSVEELKSYLASEARSLPGQGHFKMFSFLCEPTVEACTHIRVRCKFCPSRLKFKFDESKGGFFMTIGHINHEHIIRKFENQLEYDIFRYFRDKNWNDTNSRRMKKYSHDKRDACVFSKKERLSEVEKFNCFQYLEAELKIKDYEYMVDWGYFPSDRYPRLMVMASPDMRRNYRRYYELLSFDITYNLLKMFTSDGKRFRLGVFCVTDTNIRILLAGIAIISEERIQDMYKMFSFFFRIHGYAPQPQTIITDQQKTFEWALQKLKDNGEYSGVHIFDPFHIINNIRDNLKGDEDRMRYAVRLVSRSISCRTFKEYNDCMAGMDKDPENSILYDQFIDKANKICYWEIPRTFLGVIRFNCEVINDLIKKEVPYETTINRLIEKLMRLDLKLSRKSRYSYKMFKEPVYRQLEDQRIGYVRKKIEKKPFMRFLENYLKGRSEFEIASRDGGNMTVKSRFHEEFVVYEWRCSCDELDKTGIPCPHLLLCASNSNVVSYIPMIYPRWLKEVPLLSSDSIHWTKKKVSVKIHQQRYRSRKFNSGNVQYVQPNK